MIKANSNTFNCILSFFIHHFKLRPLIITYIYGVFIETRFFIFPAVLEKEFFKIFSWCKRHSPLIVFYQESNCGSTVKSCGYIV